MPERTLCHYTIEHGRMNYCDDSSQHSVRGSVEMIAIPEDYGT